MQNGNLEPGRTDGGGGRRFPGGPFLALLAGGWLLAWAIGSCQGTPAGHEARAGGAPAPEPVVAGANVAYLATPIDRAAAAVNAAAVALAAPDADPQRARDALAAAREDMEALTGFYLPLTAARDLLVQAWYDEAAGRTAQRDRDLAAAGNRLRPVTEHGSPPAAAAAGELLAGLDSLELHKGNDPKLADDLRELCTAVQDRLVAAALDLDRAAAARPAASATAAAGTTGGAS